MTERVGKYEVLAPLTDGGMAQLFLGATAGPGGFRKYVVIKRVLPAAQGDENFVRMFLDEARITAAFSYPAIAQVFDLGEDDAGFFVVMEFIAGQNLNQVVYACAKQRAVLPLGFSVAVLHECALALHYAHTFKSQTGQLSPVIHRDVAQKNIMVTYDGQVKLLDFGIAKVENALAKTKVGTVKGTAGYMSPEQVRGEQLDARSDVFALGVVLWEMVTGRRLFSAETELEELRMILDLEAESPSDVEPSVPPELSKVVLRALAKDRDARFGSARELARALNAACADYFYDSDARADFMRERFEEKIESTRALFDVAASTSDVELGRAVKNYQRQSRADDEPVAAAAAAPKKRPRTQLSEGKLEPVRNKPRTMSKSKLKPVAVKRATQPDPDEEDELDRQIAAAALGKAEKPGKEGGGATLPVLAVLTLLLGVGGSYWYFVANAEPLAPATPGVAAGLDGIPGADQHAVDQPPEHATDKPEKVEKPVEKPDRASQTAPSTPRGKGEVTLALIPRAKVMLGNQALAEGAFVTFSLPAGVHLLTIIGDDGVAHRLSLPVNPGKNVAQKFHLSELPVK